MWVVGVVVELMRVGYVLDIQNLVKLLTRRGGQKASLKAAWHNANIAITHLQQNVMRTPGVQSAQWNINPLGETHISASYFR